MTRLLEFLGTVRARSFRELLDQSLWMSQVEKSFLLDPKAPSFLVVAALNALVEEQEVLSRLAKDDSARYNSLIELNRWLYRGDKSFDNFPGLPGDAYESPLAAEPISPPTPAAEPISPPTPAAEPTSPPTPAAEPISPPTPLPEEVSEDDPIGSFGLDALSPMSRFIKVPEHNLRFDEHRFLILLAGSISLTADEKHRILEAIPRLPQYQIDELFKILEEEKTKFSSLDKKHSDSIRGLEEKHRIEWESVCRRYILQEIQTRVDVSGFFDLILSIENRFQRLRWDEAEEFLTTALAKFTSLPFIYEYQIQLIKISEELKPDLAKSLSRGVVPYPALFQVLTVLLEFEDIHLTGTKLFLEHLDRFEPPREYPYIKAYLLSKYHLYFGRSQESLKKALTYANEAIGQTDHEKDLNALLFLFHHLVRILVALREFEQIALISKQLFGTQPPLYYRYLDQLGKVMKTHSDDQCRYALDQVILADARTHENNDLVLAFEGAELSQVQKTEQDKVWKAIVAITVLLEQMGFVDRKQQALLEQIDMSIGAGRLAEAKKHEAGLKALNPCDMRARIRFCDWRYYILKKEKSLTNPYSARKKSYLEKKDLEHSVDFVLLLSYLDFSFKYEQKDVVDFLAEKYYYLAFTHCLAFDTYHYKFNEGKSETPTALHLAQALSCGLDSSLFQFLSDYYRWNRMRDHAICMGILGKVAFSSDLSKTMIASQQKKFEKQSLGLLLAMHNRAPDDQIPFSAFGVGLNGSNSDRLLAVFFAKKALDVNGELNPVIMTNKFCHEDHQKTQSQNVFYSSLMAIHCDPHKTWHSFPNLLAASIKNNDQATYLSTFYTGLDYGCPLIKDSHRKEALTIALSNLETNRGDHFPFCTYLAYALLEHKSLMIEEHGYLDMEARIFDCLYQAETLLRQHEPTSFFLGDHAHRTYLSMTAQDWYLALRHPEKTVDQKYQEKLQIMRKLKTGTNQQEHDLRNMIRDRAIRERITSLNSGRVVSDAFRTRRSCIRAAQSLFAKNDVVQTRLHEEIQVAKSQVATCRADLIVMLMKSLGPVLSGLDDKRWQQLESDFFSLLCTNQITAHYQQQFRIILQTYQLKESRDTFNDDIQLALDDFVGVQKQASERIDDLRKQSQVASFSLFKELFELVRTTHVLASSAMFESVRTRIRHGWLIAHLKDCFARHDLYMDGGDSDLPPVVANTLSRMHDKAASTAIEQVLGNLKRAFLDIVERLDKDILLLRDAHHPAGIFNYNDDLFDLKTLYATLTEGGALNGDQVASYIDAFCAKLDAQTKHCFEAMRRYLGTDVQAPLQKALTEVEEVLNHWEAAFADQINAHHKLLAGVNDAGQEFARNIKIYQSWFQFYREAVRDFQLEEAIFAAEKQVWDIDLEAIHKKHLEKANIHISEQAKVYLKGSNFPELLEVFKILFQNVIYHGKFPDEPEQGPQIEIEIRLARQGELQVQFSSFQVERVTLDVLLDEIRVPSRRARRLLQPNGTGLATIEDILANRLSGASGGIQEIGWCSQLKKLQVQLKLVVQEAGNPEDASRTGSGPKQSLKDLVDSSRDHQGLKVLIVEDQKLKFDAIRDYLTWQISDVHCTLVSDIETATRLLTAFPDYYQRLILDMTLPEDPSVDAPLKSLGGFCVLKVMAIKQIHIPTILVTQYSNWSAEAEQNTRVFIEKLDAFCTKHYSAFYLATVRFSHTETEWRKLLADAIGNQPGKRLDHSERDDLMAMAEDHRRERRFREAAEDYVRVLNMETDWPQALAGLALTCAEEGDTVRSNELLERYRAITRGGEILAAKLKAIEDRHMEIYRSEMMTTLGKMAGGMAHELNTPLQAVKFRAQGLLQSMGKRPLTVAEIRDGLGKIIAKTDFMAGQVEDIQTMARGERLPARDLDLNQLIEKSIGFFKAQLASRRIDIEWVPIANLPPIHANESRLQLVFSNLIINAQDALVGKEEPREIRVSTTFARGEDHVKVFFSDTGSGIDPSKQERIFEPFVTTKNYGRGMGLGLFNVRETIHEMGGSITCYDESSGGATFVIRLPKVKEGGKDDVPDSGGRR